MSYTRSKTITRKNLVPPKITLNSAKVVDKLDPTRTLGIRKRMCNEVARRFNSVSREIKTVLVDNDFLGLRGPKVHAQDGLYGFPRSSEKVDSFMKWLGEMERKHILTTSNVIGRVGSSSESWSDTYISAAYKQGATRANSEVNKGVKNKVALNLNAPVHADRAALLYTRAFNELKGVTDAMDMQISSVLTQGLIEGKAPKEIADALTEQVQKIGIRRAQTIARTEIVRAHHLGSIQEYTNAGILNVIVRVEWVTAGYGVCKVCQNLSGRVFTLEEITPLIPRHPGCRCVAVPYKGDLLLKEKSAALKSAEDFEKTVFTSEKEQGALFSLEGSLISKKSGGDSFIRWTAAEIAASLEKAGVEQGILTHNHPSSTSFSLSDLELMSEVQGVDTIRVAAKDGTLYSMTMVEALKGPKLKAEVTESYKRAFNEIQNEVILPLFEAGSINIDQVDVYRDHTVMERVAKDFTWMKYSRKKNFFK